MNQPEHRVKKQQNTVQDKPEWYHVWTQFLVQPPFYSGDQPERLQALLEQLCAALDAGDSCIQPTQLSADDVQAIEAISQNVVTDEAASLVRQQSRPLVWDAPYLYLQRYWMLEQQLAQRLIALSACQVKTVDLAQYLTLFDDPHQRQALSVGINQGFSMITGGPGTGKTYILTRIVAVLKKLNPELRIAMAAPTGKAAQRMQESLNKAFTDQNLLDAGLYHPDFAYQNTQTLHRLLGMGTQQVPRFHQQHPLPYDVIVVDEASMLDLQLACALFNAIKAPTRLILLGDANQLSSVDVGYVLADLQRVPQLQHAIVHLQASRRFADDANIGQFAKYIHQAQQPSFKNWLTQIQPEMMKLGQGKLMINAEQTDAVHFFELPEQPQPDALQNIYLQLAQGFQNYADALKRYQQGEIDKQTLAQHFDEYRILVAMRSGMFGLQQLNQAMSLWLKQQLNIVHDGEWFYGRPVMMIYNDYQLKLSNGDIGLCLWDEQNPDQYAVYFPSLDQQIMAARLPQSIQTAFALTIHKSQGSEFNHSAVVLDDQADKLLSQELLYTAITRAKKIVSLYATPYSMQQSLSVRTQRKSGLVQQIQRLYEHKVNSMLD